MTINWPELIRDVLGSANQEARGHHRTVLLMLKESPTPTTPMGLHLDEQDQCVIAVLVALDRALAGHLDLADLATMCIVLDERTADNSAIPTVIL